MLNNRCVAILTTLATLLLCASAWGATVEAPYLVISLVPDSGTLSNRVFAFPRIDEKTIVLLDRFTGGTPTKADLKNLLTTLRDTSETVSSRWQTNKGDVVTVYALYDANVQAKPDVAFDEQRRETQFERDLSTLVSVVAKVAGVPLGEDRSPTSVRALRSEYLLTRVRSTLKISASAAPLEEAKGVESVKAEAAITTGPIEHWYLAADLPVNKTQELKYESGNIVTKDDPSTILASVNFLLGDVLAERRAFPNGLVIKGLMRVSKKPLETFGIGIGYRVDPVTRYGFALNTVSPFVAYAWNNEADPDRPDQLHYKGSWRAGISMNLDKIMGWLK